LALAALISASYLTAARGADVYWDINGAGSAVLGDYNNDGKVDAADYVTWRKTNINGATGYTNWRTNFGALSGGAGGATPDGSWDSTTPNWSTSAAGSVATQVWNPAGTDVAVFSAGSDATGAYTVTVDSQTASGIRDEDGDVTLSSGSLTLKTGSSINVLSGRKLTAATSLVNNAAETMSKDGSGTLVLPTANNSMAGEFILNSGTLGIGNGASFGVSTGTSTLTINGGNITNGNAPGGPIVNVSGGVKTNINANFSVDDSISGALISLNGIATLNGNRTITVNGPASTSSVITATTTGTRGLAFGNLQETGGSYGITKLGPGTLRFEVSSTNAANAAAFTGDVTVSQGVLEVSSTGWIGKNGANTIRLAGGDFNLSGFGRGTGNPINNPIIITANAEITETLDAANVTSGNNLNLFGQVSTPNNSLLTFRNKFVQQPGTGGAIFNPRFNGDGLSYTYTGPIAIVNNANNGTWTNPATTRFSTFNFNTGQNGAYTTGGSTLTFSGVLSGDGSISRSSTAGGTGGNTILTAANTYSGGTLINDGTLYVNNTSGSGTGTGSVSVNAGTATTFYNAGNLRGILAGNGSLTGAITVGRSGVLKPGTIASPIAALSGGALTFSDANILFPAAVPATYAYDINSSLSPAAGADLLNVNGDLTFAGPFAALSVTDLAATSASLGNGTKFTLISYSGNWDGNTFSGLPDDTGTVTVSSGGGATNTFTINYNDVTPGSNLGGGLYTKYVTLTRTSAGSGSLVAGTVPEPTSAMLALVGLVPLLWRGSR